MWVRRTRPPLNRISTCLPAAATRSTVRPVIGASSWTRVSAGSTDSKRTTTPPPSARSSVRAVRKIASPSGTSADPAHLEAHRRRVEAGLDQERRKRMARRILAVDVADQQAAAPLLPRDAGERAGERAAGGGSRGLVLGQVGGELTSAARQVGGEHPVD